MRRSTYLDYLILTIYMVVIDVLVDFYYEIVLLLITFLSIDTFKKF